MTELELRRPLVTIGIPTRNGARTVAHAIRSACEQDYPNLEIVVSENASEDQTADVVSEFARNDPRVRIIKQQKSLTMLANYRAAWEAARGEYFMWLADDDLIERSFISHCVKALEGLPDAVLAFGEVIGFSDYADLSDAAPLPLYDFDTRGQSSWRRLVKDRHSGYEIKGLFRRDLLLHFGWYEHTVSPDWPQLTFLMIAGEVVFVPQATLFSGANIPETGADRARAQSFATIERFPTATLSWRCGLAARDAARLRGERRIVLADAAVTFCSLLWVNRRWLVPRLLEPWKERLRAFRAARSPGDGTGGSAPEL